MSDNYLRLIPQDPTWVPPELPATRARKLVRERLPMADEVSLEFYEQVSFIDCGGNSERTSCPGCDATLADAWWGRAMDEAWEKSFTDLRVTTPCCETATTLNDLRYEWPQGFARFVLEAMNPNIASTPEQLVRDVEEILGCPLRVIWAHY